MASKRPRPYDVPPSPESSEEEEEDEEVEEQVEGEEVEEEEEEEVDEEEEEDEDEEKPVPLKKDEDEEEEEDPEEEEEEEEEESDSPIKKTPKPVADSGSDTETDTTPKTSTYTIKPVAKEDNADKKPVKGFKVKDEDEKKGNSMINRVWSFDDEIYVMQAMIDFKKENNKDPTSSHEEFFNFVKGKLCNDKFTKVQVMDKIRRLKKKYRNNLNKSATTGKDPDFSNPHEFKSFKLSKKIWGDLINGSNANVGGNSGHLNAKTAVVSLPVVNGGESNGNGKTVNKSAKKSKTMTLEKVNTPVQEEDMMEVDGEKKVGEKGFKELYPHLMKAFEGESVPRVPLLDGLKGCLSTVESSKLEEWDRKWKKVRLAETDAYIGRLALIQEQTSWFSDAMKSSKY